MKKIFYFSKIYFLLPDKVRESDRQGKMVEYEKTGQWPGQEKNKRQIKTVPWSKKVDVKVTIRVSTFFYKFLPFL